MTATEAERRRATGEEPFEHRAPCVKVARVFLFDATHGAWDISQARQTSFACEAVAALLRALVLQELLKTFSPPWEVTP